MSYVSFDFSDFYPKVETFRYGRFYTYLFGGMPRRQLVALNGESRRGRIETPVGVGYGKGFPSPPLPNRLGRRRQLPNERKPILANF